VLNDFVVNAGIVPHPAYPKSAACAFRRPTYCGAPPRPNEFSAHVFETSSMETIILTGSIG